MVQWESRETDEWIQAEKEEDHWRIVPSPEERFGGQG
jgi:hypothetical protein